MTPIRRDTVPVRDHNRGTFLVDRIFRIAGRRVRLKRASGTRDAKLWRRYNDMLDVLAEGGRQDVLLRLASGSLSFQDVWTHYSAGQWDRIPAGEHMAPLWRSLAAWVKTYPRGEAHRTSMRRSFADLEVIGVASATIAELPGLLTKHRQRCHAAGHARTFNLARAHVQAFLREKVTREDRLYRAVADLKPLAVAPSFVRHPLSVAEARELGGRLTEKAAPIFWALCLTGMNPKEFWDGRWSVEADRVVIRGTKAAGRRRIVPRLCVPAAPELTRWGFRQALRRAAGIAPYDCRRTYANWLEAAGIPRTRRRLYMGHGARDVTDLYERHEVEAFLAEDGAKLQGHVGGVVSAGLRVMR